MLRKRHIPADEPHFLVRTMAAEFAHGDTIAPHAHDWGQLIYAASGLVTVWTEHGSWVVPPHWAVWAPPGVRHGLCFTGAASLRTLYVRPDVANPSSRGAVVPVSPLLRELILRAVHLQMLDAREHTHRSIVDLIVQECSTAAAPPLDLPLPRNERLRQIAEHLSQRPRDRTSHAALARRFGVGVRTLERGFTAETGLSLGQWRRQARFMHALQQLGAGASVKRAAAEAGYRTQSAFIAAFRALLKTTPGRYFKSGHREDNPGSRPVIRRRHRPAHRLAVGCVLAIIATVACSAMSAQAQPEPTDLQIFATGTISTEAPEFAIAFTPDGREVYFNRASADRTRLAIMVATRSASGAFSQAAVASFSGTFRDVDPFVSADGRRLYFSSDRPRRPDGPRTLATWYMERSATGWSQPIDPGPPLNSDAGDVFVSAARDGTVVFTSNRDGPQRVYASREVNGRWQQPVPLSFGGIVDAGNPMIAPSGRFLILVRAPAGGAANLFVSCRTTDGWSEPRALNSGVNSEFADFAPSVDPNEAFLYFTSERPGVVGPQPAGVRPPGDIYRVGLVNAGVRCEADDRF